MSRSAPNHRTASASTRNEVKNVSITASDAATPKSRSAGIRLKRNELKPTAVVSSHMNAGMKSSRSASPAALSLPLWWVCRANSERKCTTVATDSTISSGGMMVERLVSVPVRANTPMPATIATVALTMASITPATRRVKTYIKMRSRP